jgi:hypothetical protein
MGRSRREAKGRSGAAAMSKPDARSYGARIFCVICHAEPWPSDPAVRQTFSLTRFGPNGRPAAFPESGEWRCEQHPIGNRGADRLAVLKRIAKDMFDSETRSGWLANNCSWIGADPDSTEEQYVALYVEENWRRDITELEVEAAAARPESAPAARDRELYERARAAAANRAAFRVVDQ